LRDHLRSHLPQAAADRTQLEAAVQFTTGALSGLLTWWVAADIRCSADEVHAMFGRLTIPGLRRFFAPAPRGDDQRSGIARSRFGRSRPPSTSRTLPVM